MGLSCDYDFDPEPGMVCWHWPGGFSVFDRKRATKCCSCGEKITGGNVLRFSRYKVPEYEIEERIYGDCGEDGPRRAPWFMCVDCGNIALFLLSFNYSFYLEDNMRDLAKEHAAMAAENRAGCL